MGTFTLTVASRAPVWPERFTSGMPMSLKRKLLPDWVPAGTLRRSDLPEGVGTSTVQPRASSYMETGTSIATSADLPRRLNTGWSATWNSMSMLPRGPPFTPYSP